MRSADRTCDLSGRIALVTGAGSGLGRSIALAFARSGCDIVAVDIDSDRLTAVAREVEATGVLCLPRVVDVSSRVQMEKMAGEVLAAWGHVDILVNNAGVAAAGELQDVPIDDLEWIVGINLMGEVYGSRLFLPGMIERGWGKIVNVASVSGLVVLPFHIPYTTTKFAVNGFSQTLWAEARKYGVDVTLVCPAAVKTNIISGSRLTATTKGHDMMVRLWEDVLIRTGLDPDEVARRVLKAVQRRKFLVITGVVPRLMYYVTRLSPGFMMRLADLITRVAGRR
jgi:short-subunit dehydrogenase